MWDYLMGSLFWSAAGLVVGYLLGYVHAHSRRTR